MKRNCKRFLRSLPVLALALCLVLADLTPAAAVTQADIDALKSDAKDLAQEKKEIQAQIDKLSAEIRFSYVWISSSLLAISSNSQICSSVSTIL